jgi:hypothetical protein
MNSCRYLGILLALLLVGSADAAAQEVLVWGWGNHLPQDMMVPSGLHNVIACVI